MLKDPLRGRLLELAEDATQRGWWEDYADALTPEYLDFIGLEAEAVSSLQWQADASQASSKRRITPGR